MGLRFSRFLIAKKADSRIKQGAINAIIDTNEATPITSSIQRIPSYGSTNSSSTPSSPHSSPLRGIDLDAITWKESNEYIHQLLQINRTWPQVWRKVGGNYFPASVLAIYSLGWYYEIAEKAAKEFFDNRTLVTLSELSTLICNLAFGVDHGSAAIAALKPSVSMLLRLIIAATVGGSVALSTNEILEKNGDSEFKRYSLTATMGALRLLIVTNSLNGFWNFCKSLNSTYKNQKIELIKELYQVLRLSSDKQSRDQKYPELTPENYRQLAKGYFAAPIPDCLWATLYVPTVALACGYLIAPTVSTYDFLLEKLDSEAGAAFLTALMNGAMVPLVANTAKSLLDAILSFFRPNLIPGFERTSSEKIRYWSVVAVMLPIALFSPVGSWLITEEFLPFVTNIYLSIIVNLGIPLMNGKSFKATVDSLVNFILMRFENQRPATAEEILKTVFKKVVGTVYTSSMDPMKSLVQFWKTEMEENEALACERLVAAIKTSSMDFKLLSEAYQEEKPQDLEKGNHGPQI